VMEVGPGVAQCAVGDHVVMSFMPMCGACSYCEEGRPNLCQTAFDVRATGALLKGDHRLSLGGEPLNHVNGVSCYAEYMVAAEESAIVIDRDVPMVDAALFGCAVVTGVGAVVNTGQVQPGTTVAVVGLGGVGLCSVLGAQVAGAARIVAIDLAEDKLAFARQLGATDTFNAADPDCAAQVKEATQGGVDTAIEVAGVTKAMETAYAVTRRGGTTVTAGLSHHEHKVELPQSHLVFEERTVKGSFMGGCVVRRDVPRYLALYKPGRLPIDRLRSGLIGLEDLNEGFDKLARGEAIRQMLVMHDEFAI